MVVVPPERFERWVAAFVDRHGPPAAYGVHAGALRGEAADGSTFTARLPFAAAYAGPAAPDGFGSALGRAAPERWGVLLVRKGGFAVARVAGARVVASKVGQRHVQGRTKAGGQSSQRFARRREQQARRAYEAAAEHAARLLGGAALPVVTGGDRSAVEEVLADPRLRRLTVVGAWLPTPDPRRDVLDRAVRDARGATIEVVNADVPVRP